MESSTESSGKTKAGVSIFAVMMILSMGAPIWFFFIGPQMRHDRLAEKGIHAPGRLLSVDESGNMINDVAELEIVVEFTRKDGKLDTAETDFLPSQRNIHMFQPGAGVTAAYDPEDPHEITLLEISDGKAAPGGSVMGVMESQSSVDSLRRVNDSLTAELARLKK